jgi:hypothetical protein
MDITLKSGCNFRGGSAGKMPQEDFEMAAERNPGIRGAVDTLYRIREDPEVQAQMEYRGRPVDQIAEDTGFSAEEIAKL